MNDVPTTPSICPGRCNLGWRAAENRWLTKGIEHDLEPREGQPVWCPPCTTDIRAALADMPALAEALREEIESGIAAVMGEYVSGSKNRPVHDHEAASFLLDEFTEWISEWEATVRVQLELSERRPVADHCTAVANAAGFLLPHLDWHLAGRCEPEWDHLHADDYTGADIAHDFGSDLFRYHRRAQALTGNQDPEPVRVVGVECPSCGYKTLEHEVEPESGRKMQVARYRLGPDGQPLIGRDREGPESRPVRLTETLTVPKQGVVTGYIRCRRCRPELRMAPDQLDQWMKILAAGKEVRQLATPELLAEIFGGSVPQQYRALA